MSDSTAIIAHAESLFDRGMSWIKRHERIVLLATVAFQILFLLSLIGRSAMPLWFGDTILVRVVPVDPRDMFRGDYVILAYEFNRPQQSIEGLPNPSWNDRDTQVGQTVYVTLVPEADGQHWRPASYSIHRPTSGKYLTGSMSSRGNLEFGIEQYFVQEGTGHDYEDAIRTRKLSAELAVTADGQAAIRGLRIE